MEDEKIDLRKYIEEFIKGDIEDERFKNFNKYSVRQSIAIDNEDKQYIYNEMSFQHELGQYLRKRLNENNQDRFMIQYERNINDMNIDFSQDTKLRKHEMDIVITDTKKNKYYLIELKYHKKERKRYPNTMFDCVKDIDFVHNVVTDRNSPFIKGFCVTIVEDATFYKTNSNKYEDKLYTNYWCFRDIDKRSGFEVRKAGNKEESQSISITEYINKYLPIREVKEDKKVENIVTLWNKIIENNEARYYIIEINK